MSFEALRIAVSTHFQRGWKKAPEQPGGDPLDFMPTQWENRSFKQPSETWVRFSIREGTRNPAAIGQDFSRLPGIVFLQVFVPEDGGSQPAKIAADKAADIFDHQNLIAGPGLDVLFYTVSLSPVGKTSQGWQQFNISAPFRYDILRQPRFVDSETGAQLIDSETGRPLGDSAGAGNQTGILDSETEAVLVDSETELPLENGPEAPDKGPKPDPTFGSGELTFGDIGLNFGKKKADMGSQEENFGDPNATFGDQ